MLDSALFSSKALHTHSKDTIYSSLLVRKTICCFKNVKDIRLISHVW